MLLKSAFLSVDCVHIENHAKCNLGVCPNVLKEQSAGMANLKTASHTIVEKGNAKMRSAWKNDSKFTSPDGKGPNTAALRTAWGERLARCKSLLQPDKFVSALNKNSAPTFLVCD